MKDTVKNFILWSILGAILFSVLGNFSGQNTAGTTPIAYSQFLERIEANDLESLMIDGQSIRAVTRTGDFISSYAPYPIDNNLVAAWHKAGNISIMARPPEKPSILLQIFMNCLPIVIFLGASAIFMRNMQGGGKGALSFGRSRARLMSEDEVVVTFADVAGVDEAKAEVAELVEFLREPNKFRNLGGKIPRGVLMIGPPGTGKTLLARAIAGEAKVPFFTISGSDFVEMFVGVGASRVRDMFEQAKKHAPCIIFIDEIDAVGRHRGAGLGGGHDEREQTLNQLLVEMDGFGANAGVIVIAATNRPDVLDPALLRPGRFDRQVAVGLPDLRGREQILKVHIKKVPSATDVQPRVIARGTPGFSGADLANLVNEAALFAAKANKKIVAMEDFERAKDKILMGVEYKSIVMSEKERKLTAYHEAGHAIVGLLVPASDPVYKITIIPRSKALGLTFFLPEQDRYSQSREQLESILSTLFGGRIAEELIFGPAAVTTGAASDIQKASDMARKMVTRWGLSNKLGPLTYGHDDSEVFLGHAMAKSKEFSDATFKLIDEEVRHLVDQAYQKAEALLKANMDKLHNMAAALLKYETIDQEQIGDIMQDLPVRNPSNWEETEKA